MRTKLVNIAIIIACLCAGATPGIIGAQIEPSPSGPVDYGPTITTDRDKLSACYSLSQQMVDEYNRQSAIAAANQRKYDDKFRAYARTEWLPRYRRLASEMQSLKDTIRGEVYTEKQWSEVVLDPELEANALTTLFGDRDEEKQEPTLAVCDDLASLKLVDLDTIEPTPGVDPLEDFTTYDETDEGNDLTITTNKVEVTGAQTRLYHFVVEDDKGAGHFDGDFEHRFKMYIDTYPSVQATGVWSVCTEGGAGEDALDHFGAPDETLLMRLYDTGIRVVLYQKEAGGGTNSDEGNVLSLDTQYYVSIIRDDDYGTYGHLDGYVCTGNYWGESGSSTVSTMSFDLGGEKSDYRYVTSITSWDADHSAAGCTMDLEDLDLQEGAGPTAVPFSFGYILGG